MSNAKIGAAVLAGYLLGRTKKAKLALSLGAMLAGSRVKPGQVGKLLQDSPFLGNVSKEVRTELAEAGKAAATTVLSAKAESLADAIHERTEGLQERAHGKGVRDRDEVDRGEEDEEEEQRGEGREKKAQHRGPGREGEPRRRKATAAQSRSRRPDDG
jgi:hypothetical protein